MTAVQKSSESSNACVACPLCGHGDQPHPVYPELSIVRCGGCDLVYYMGPADAAALYGDNYFTGAEYRDYLADQAVHRANFQRRLRDVRRLVSGGKLFEIGCAYGLFLDEARAFYEVHGVDVAPAATAHAREQLHLDARCADFLDLPDEPESYDVICMWDTIEHLARPFAYLDKAARWLRPGGWLLLTTGNFASVVSRLRGRKWRLIHPPTHLFYFTPETLGQAVERAGLTPAGCRHVGYRRYWGSMMHNIFGGTETIGYRLLTFGGRLNFPIPLNLYDIMLFTARRP
jgi:2-polyprenyl-3-methyl-5-hydroxy-6-metoxy-1,4-benzoquinol methylase